MSAASSGRVSSRAPITTMRSPGRAVATRWAAAAARPGCTDPALVDTNIVVLDVPDARALVLAAAQRGVALSALGPRTARLVTHLDVDDAGTDLAAEVLAELLSR